MYPSQILDALRTVRYPGNGKNLVEAGMVEDDIRIDGHDVSFSLIFDKSTDPFLKSVVKAAQTAVKTFADPEAVVTVNTKFRQEFKPKPEKKLLPGVKNIIGVASGKGGVGKSTVAANLAVALARQGHKVGLLDADIFGPSVPKMFGIEGEQLFIHKVDGRDMIIPIERHGVKLLSIGLLVEPEKAVLWRGSMASTALRQLIEDADWGELDYFLIDMPPGTSDIHLTLVQTLPMTGALIVTTPQEVATADARKGIAMFRVDQINVPVLGLVENMAYFVPEKHPDERYYLFGREGGVRLAREMDVPLLAQIPIVADIADSGDHGTPIAASDSIEGDAFASLARKVVEAVDRRNKELPPTTKVEMKK